MMPVTKNGVVKTTRREVVLERLISQLKKGTKPSKEVEVEDIPLLDKDRHRIEKEIDILKGAIKAAV